MENGLASPEKPSTAFELRTLGVAGLFRADDQTQVLGPGKPLAVVTYLALAPGRRASRESLIDLLWADLDPERARRALRQTLFHLRRLIGEESLAGVEELSLSSVVTVDRDAFLVALEGEEIDRAVASYGGEFLPAFGVPGGAGFEQWADLERGRLQAAYIRAGELLVRRHLNRGEARDGRRVARMVRDRALHDEAAWRLVLEAAVSARDFVSAGVEAAALEEWAAASQLVLEPATRAALARARRVAPPSERDAHAPTLVAELTGREREFHEITTAWESVRTGAARHIHLSAPAGLGKSRLLHDAVSRLQANAARVVSLRGTSGDRDVPYAFAADLAAALASLPGAAGVAPASAATLLALNPALSALLSGQPDAAPADEVLRRRIHALADLASSVAHEQRFALVVDDVHWIDAPSQRVLEGLLSRLGESRVLCLTAARPERRIGGDRTTVLTLQPLSEAQVGVLVAALGALPTHEAWSTTFAAGLHAASHGSPLLLLETLRLALDASVLTLENGEWGCRDAARLNDVLRAGEALRARVRALSDEAQHVLALLATAGVPIDEHALAAMQRVSTVEVVPQLAMLEQHGLAVRAGAGWAPAHDEIADAALTGLTDAQRAAAERELGEWFSRESDPISLLRAAHHARTAGYDDLVTRLFLRYAQRARVRGDGRRFAAIASEFAADDDALAERLARQAPWSWRVGLWTPARRRVAGFSVLLAIVAIGAGVWARQAREATLPRLHYFDSTGQALVATVQGDEWDGRSEEVRPARRALTRDEAALAKLEYLPAFSPDGRSVAWTQDAGDSTTFDLWLRTPAGTRRLTNEPRDDIAHQWLPDGSGIAGTSMRWSAPTEGDYDVAVFDTASGAARQITRGRGHDTMARVSPDGSRIAFTRESDEMIGQLCVVSIDGRHEPECRSPAGHRILELVGWSGTDELVVIVEDGVRRPLTVLDWSANRLTELLGPIVSRGAMSANRRWVVAEVRREGVRGARDWIVPLTAPSKARPLSAAVHGARWWTGPMDTTQIIRRLELIDSATTIPFGIGTRLRVRSLSSMGVEVPLYVPLTWTTSDSTIARVDSLGEVRPLSAGRVTIGAEIGGWRRVERTFTIVGEPPKTVLREAWDETWQQRWLPWGDPQPTVKVGPSGVRAFSNNGDGVFISTGVLRQALSARQGLGVEMRVSSPLTRTKWQRVRVYWAAGIDTAALMAADQFRGPPSLGRPDAICGINFPEPSNAGANRMTMSGGPPQSVDLGALAPMLRSGAWWTLRVQILPDGRCGVAVNGRAVWLSTETVPLDADFRLRLGDESKATTILHGPLEVWTGVRTDVEWTRRR